MKKKGSSDPGSDTAAETDDMLPEYRFDYRKARPNRFAPADGATPLVVTLDPDVAAIFTTSESVNAVLRALIQTMPSRMDRENQAA